MGYKLVLGLGNNVDYEMRWDSGVVEQLARKYAIGPEDLAYEGHVADERGLVCSILGFLNAGQGGERFVASPDIIGRFSALFDVKVTLGGTPIRAAIAIAKLGYVSALHYVNMNEHVRRLTPPGCAYVCSGDGCNLYPHLIVQYRQGDRVKTHRLDIAAPCANRIIYDHDPENIQMALSPDLAAYCQDASVFLISGFNAMQDSALLVKRIRALKDIMQGLPKGAVVFYEDGGFYDDRLRFAVRDGLEERVHIHSMNEDELAVYLGRRADLLDGAQMARAVADVAAILGAPTLVVHTKHWALAYGQNAGGLRRALEGGVALAGTRYRLGDDFGPADYAATQRLPRAPQGQAFAQAMEAIVGERACCVPCYAIADQNVTTIGLGDAFVGGFLAALSDKPVVY